MAAAVSRRVQAQARPVEGVLDDPALSPVHFDVLRTEERTWSGQLNRPPLATGTAVRRGLAAVLMGFALAAAARGDDASPPDAEPAPEADVSFDLGWDRGLTYDVRRQLPISRTGLPNWLDDVSLRGRIGASLYLDGGFTAGVPDEGDGLAGEVRRARIYTSGRFQYALPIEYKVEFAVESDRVLLNDFYLGWRPPRYVDRLRVGYFDPPATLQNLVSSSSRGLMEVGSPVAAFAPGYRLGVDVKRRHRHPSLSWFLNLSTVGQQAEVGDASEERLRIFGRVVWRPLGEPREGTPLLHLGLSTSYAPDAGGTTIRYRSRPESFLAEHVVDTGELAGSARVLGVEAAWQSGPRILQVEALFSRVDADTLEDSSFYGLYVQGRWALSGELRRYDASESVFGRLVPERPFAPRQGHWGAFELAARLSWLDLSNGGVQGGEMLSFTVGPAWTLSRSVRVLAGYVVARIRDRPDPGTLHIVQARLELAF